MSISGIALALSQAALLLALSPFVIGVIRQVRARAEGRQGAGIRQPWRDIRKLLRKERIRPVYASWIFHAAPMVLFITSIVVATIIPSITTRSAANGSADFLAVVFLLLAGTIFLALAGLDAGSAFGGMGSSREMTIAALAEPTLLLAILAVSARAQTSGLGEIVKAGIDHPSMLIAPASLLALGALAIVTLAENGRIPVDNPATHLELTMVHEAMTLEHSGRDLALIELASYMRLVFYLTLIANLFVPWGVATTLSPAAIGIGIVALLGKLVVLAAVLSMVEVLLAKLRLFRIPELLAGSFVLSFLAVTVSSFLA